MRDKEDVVDILRDALKEMTLKARECEQTYHIHHKYHRSIYNRTEEVETENKRIRVALRHLQEQIHDSKNTLNPWALLIRLSDQISQVLNGPDKDLCKPEEEK